MKRKRKMTVQVRDFIIDNDLPFTLIAGPCAIESADHALKMQEEIKAITDRLGINYIFKSSFDKANRTSIKGQRGLGLDDAVQVFERLKKNTPILTDVHETWQCDIIKYVVDVVQIPAFLCRQTDLLLAAANTGLVVNVKKGQFISPSDMLNIIAKIESTGNNQILLTERGTFFGYGNLVVDFRSLPIMAKTGYPVVMDVTHSVQRPSGQGDSSGGEREFIEPLACAAIAVGVGAIFMEVHDNPDQAISDGPNQLHLNDLEKLLVKLKGLDRIIKAPPKRKGFSFGSLLFTDREPLERGI